MNAHEKELVQRGLAKKVILADGFSRVKWVAGVDSAFLGEKLISAAVSIGKNVEKKHSICNLEDHYQPGFLMFTEGPCMVEALRLLENQPDLIFVDGHGIAHPRRSGLASYVGVMMNLPSIGVAKKLLVGEYKEPKRKNDARPLFIGEEQVGWVLKSGKSFSPIFISPGHLVSLKSALELTLKFLKGHKLPEPLFQAHIYANEVRRRRYLKR